MDRLACRLQCLDNRGEGLVAIVQHVEVVVQGELCVGVVFEQGDEWNTFAAFDSRGCNKSLARRSITEQNEENQTSYGDKNDSHSPRKTPYGFALLLDNHHDYRHDDDRIDDREYNTQYTCHLPLRFDRFALGCDAHFVPRPRSGQNKDTKKFGISKLNPTFALSKKIKCWVPIVRSGFIIFLCFNKNLIKWQTRLFT